MRALRDGSMTGWPGSGVSVALSRTMRSRQLVQVICVPSPAITVLVFAGGAKRAASHPPLREGLRGVRRRTLYQRRASCNCVSCRSPVYGPGRLMKAGMDVRADHSRHASHRSPPHAAAGPGRAQPPWQRQGLLGAAEGMQPFSSRCVKPSGSTFRSGWVSGRRLRWTEESALSASPYQDWLACMSAVVVC